MGYMLSSLANLPVDDDVRFYVFVINGQWQEPTYTILEQNFTQVAKSIGKSAVIAKGLNPQEWYGQIAETYLGKEHGDLFPLLPALLITDAHPSTIAPESLRLLVPLRDVEERFGGWPQFFSLLTDFVQLKSDTFVQRFQTKESAVDAANSIVELRPGMFGISININELISRWRKRKAASGAAS
jgi:hypothetical protein